MRALWLLWPLECFYRVVTRYRRKRLQQSAEPLPLPVIVVGNVAVGGTGKTPLVIALVRWLQSQGYKPGVISRGYGGQAPTYPYVVKANASAELVGDEPLLIARSTGCPVVVGPDRVADVRALQAQFDCDIVVSDDGLQHYRLHRDIEIAVIDGVRGFGNGHCLPVGPLREPENRLDEVDLIVVNGDSTLSLTRSHCEMRLEPGKLKNLKTGKTLAAGDLIVEQIDQQGGGRVHAVAGIGNPKRFFTTLVELGLTPIPHVFPDHYAYTERDLRFEGELPLVMTEKDAVKCAPFASDAMWSLPVQAALPASFYTSLERKLKKLSEDKG
ncbi:tetraacyldisaccharide 4'-kinase [Litorivivens lipolytica]|uniref:Tetraacyldisaccharide 4'-kinase n=1 Tax=Litorivivens lipolytica TaxID=1524264 RepID=A0A7W4W2V3_9GAMM|nr:tetraacyldisaccharide 4'-kinase [Litorivivens lipolytica]MBB3046305.1 tetraacyldisaccharide 4'-kinase [Litorivivens lipolytica]